MSFVSIQHGSFCALKLLPSPSMAHYWPKSQPLTAGVNSNEPEQYWQLYLFVRHNKCHSNAFGHSGSLTCVLFNDTPFTTQTQYTG